jgi:hypothetical protein
VLLKGEVIMRYVSLTAVAVAVSALVPSALLGQIDSAKLSIQGYQILSEVPYMRTQYYYTYKASLVNTGPALPAITATVTSGLSSASVVPGMGNLHFPPAATNTTVDSLNTFTILVDRTLTFGFNALTWSYVAPVANAGPDQTGSVGFTVTLNGSGTTNPSGLGTLTYSWALTSVPAGSAASITNPTSVTPTFVPDVQGTYKITLTASNGAGTDTSTVNVNVNTGPPPPVADAGPNQLVAVGATAHLDGSKSHDFNNKPLTYSWSLIQRPAGSNAVLNGASTVSPTFVADVAAVTSATAYIAQLVVNDGNSSSPPATVIITTGPPPPPTANAGPPQSVTTGALVQLDGSKSTDVGGSPLTYKWSLLSVPSGSTAKLSSASLVNPTFTADQPGTYIAQLIVNDTFQDSTPSTVTITATPVQNKKPTANAGQPQTVQIGAAGATPVALSGSGTDPQGLSLTLHWTLPTVPPGSSATLSNANTATPTFTPDVIGPYVATLVVNNGVQDSDPSSVTITVTDKQPISNAGPPQTVVVGATVTLDGSGSSDSNHATLKNKWSLLNVPSGSTAALTGATTVSPTFVADLQGTYVVQLIVNDGIQDSLPATVTITAAPANTISLAPDPLNLITNVGMMTITLGQAAGSGGQVITLTVLDPSVATAPPTVNIAQGATSTTATITPLKVGSTNIFASAAGFKPGSATINVSQAIITLTLSSSTVGVGNTVTGTITLNSPAAGTGVNIGLSLNKTGFVSLSSTSVNIPGGSTTGTFTITGGPSAGGPTTVTASAAGYTSGTAPVTSVTQGSLTVQSGVTVAPGQTMPIAISVGPTAAVQDVTVTLTSSDPTKLTVTPSIVIPAGSTTPTTPAQVVGVNFGQATVTASGTGYVGGNATVTVAANLTFSSQTVTVGTGGTANVTLTLAPGTAPAGGITVTLVSDATNVATVPQNVSIPQNQSTATVTVSGAVAGTAHITATSSVGGIASGSMTVNVVTGLAITTTSPLPSGTTNSAYSTPVTATGGTTPYTWSATGLPAGLTINASTGVISGTPTAAGTSIANVTVKDSTSTQLSASASLSITIVPPLTITTTSPLPNGVVNVAYGGATVAATGGTTPYIWSATGLPAGLTINAATGVISGTPTSQGTSTASVTVKDAGNPQLTTSASLSITIGTTPVISTQSPLPNGVVNSAYSTTVAATGGATPYTWSATGLPAGLSINASSGVISGTPTAPGTSTTNVTVKDANQQSGSASLSITIISQLAITTASPLGSGTVNATYSATVAATGGVTSYTWSATGLPAGLSINASTGVISGTPTTAGTSTANVTVKDSGNPQQTASATLSITIGTAPVISTQSPLTNGAVNLAYSTTVQASGGTTPYTWSATNLPAGLSINAGTGVISGTPTAPGTSTASVTVTDANQQTGSASLSITILPQLTITTASPLVNGAVNTAYTATVAATGGVGPYTWSATGLPAGLTINAGTGVISGTPTAPGTSTANVTVKDSGNPQQNASASLAITVNPQLTITTASPLVNGTASTAYSATVAATGGVTPYTWSATGLPAGLSINASTGVISGTPIAAATSTASVTVKDSGPPQQTATATLSITIVPKPLQITTAILPDGNEFFAYSAPVSATGGTTPYTWSATGLPAGLAINSTTGVISGTPSTGTAGVSAVTVTVKDSSAPQQSATAVLQISIIPTGTDFLTISGGTVGQNLQIPITVTLTPASPGGMVQILSSNGAAVLLANHAGDTGTGSLSVATSAGQTSFSVFALGVANSGSATLTASFANYTHGQSVVTAAPSAFVLAARPNGIGGSFTSGQNAGTQLTVWAAQLDSSGNVAQIQSVAGGPAVAVTLTVGDPNLGTVSPAAVAFTGGATSATTQFTAGTSAVTSTITASEPAGFSTPSSGANVLAVTVTNQQMSCASVTVGQNLETLSSCSLTGAAQSDTTVTLTSNDPSKLLLATDPSAPGAVVITRTIRAGGSNTTPFYVYGLGNSGTATFGASGAGFTATGTVTLAKSGFVLAGPFGLGSDFQATAGGAPQDVMVQTALLDASGKPVDTQSLAGGLTAQVTVTSSNTAVGTISGSPAVITGPNNSAYVQFQAAATSGTTALTAGTPSGYTTPSQFATINATVGQPKIIIDRDNTIGKNLERAGTIILLGAAAPANGLIVHLAASGPVSLSTTGLDAGFNSIDVTIPAGQSSGTYFMYGQDVSGSATITATAPGYTTGTGTETLTPSGIVVAGPLGVGWTTFNTLLASGNQTLSISTAQLDSMGRFVQTQPLAGTVPLTLSLTNTDATVGTVPATVVITPGTDTGTVQFQPLNAGTNMIGVVQPAGGYTPPTDGTGSLRINVQ